MRRQEDPIPEARDNELSVATDARLLTQTGNAKEPTRGCDYSRKSKFLCKHVSTYNIT